MTSPLFTWNLANLCSCLRTTQDVPNNCLSRFTWRMGNKLETLIKPKCPFHSAAFNVHTLNQLRQKASLPRTIETLKINICCISWTFIQVLKSIVTFRSLDPLPLSYFTLRMSDGLVSSARGHVSVEIVLSTGAGLSPLDWISAYSHVQFDLTVLYVSLIFNWRVVVCSSYLCTPTKSISSESYWDLCRLLQSMHSTCRGRSRWF